MADAKAINEVLGDAESDWTAFPGPDGGVRIMAPDDQHIADFPPGTTPEIVLVALEIERHAWDAGVEAGREDANTAQHLWCPFARNGGESRLMKDGKVAWPTSCACIGPRCAVWLRGGLRGDCKARCGLVAAPQGDE